MITRKIKVLTFDGESTDYFFQDPTNLSDFLVEMNSNGQSFTNVNYTVGRSTYTPDMQLPGGNITLQVTNVQQKMGPIPSC